MKTTNDLQKAGVAGSQTEAIASTLHEIVDEQAATNEAPAAQGRELEETNEAPAAQGKELAAQSKELAALKAGLAALSEGLAGLRREVTSQSGLFKWAIGLLGMFVLFTAAQSFRLNGEVSRLSGQLEYMSRQMEYGVARMDSIAAAPPAAAKTPAVMPASPASPAPEKQPAVAAPGQPELSSPAP